VHDHARAEPVCFTSERSAFRRPSIPRAGNCHPPLDALLSPRHIGLASAGHVVTRARNISLAHNRLGWDATVASELPTPVGPIHARAA